MTELEAHADEELRKRTILIEEELSDIRDGRCDAVVAVSKGTFVPSLLERNVKGLLTVST